MKKHHTSRALLMTVLALSFFGLGDIAASPSVSRPLSPEIGFSSYSPINEKGGAIIPASCESGYEHLVISTIFARMLGIQPEVCGPVCQSNSGQSCTSAANVCGQTNSGTIACNGTCSATRPGNASCNGVPCTSSPNSCGDTNGTYNASGVCVPPSVPANYGQSCASAPNICGQTNGGGTIQCNGTCSALPPSNASCNGLPCTSSPNTCGNTNGTYNASGVCVPPSVPANYGFSCTGPANSCGLRNFGSIGCTNNCSAQFAPPESQCQTLNATTTGTTLTAAPQVTNINGFSDLSWQSDEGSCVLYNAASGVILATSTSGTLRVGPLSSSTRYIFACGNKTVSLTVRTDFRFNEF